MRLAEPVKSKILVIDDNVTNLKVASEHLKAAGYEVLTARDGETGLKRARFARPDLILLDVQMPGIDGFETCRQMKIDTQVCNMPVIFTTVLTNVEDKLKGFEVGGVDYVSKPFQVEELLARVNTHLMIYILQRELQAEIRERKLAETALHKANLELQRLAVLDDLTQIPNRRRFNQYLEEQWSLSTRSVITLLLCDVDYFKRYNDGYGHQAGDVCLQMVAQGISRAVSRINDLVARYGGEEFVIILPDTDIAGALGVAHKIQAELGNLRLPHAYSEVSQFITLSIGIATSSPDFKDEPSLVIAAADAALYEAKATGRNRAVVASGQMAPS